LGGHSLKAVGLLNRIHKEFSVEVPLGELFKNPYIYDIAGYIQRGRWALHTGIEPVEKKEYYPLSSAQQRLYILQQMELESTAYNMPRVLPLSASADIKRLTAAFRELTHRHESLRTSFHMCHDEPVQQIHHDPEFEIEYFDLHRTQVEVKVKVEEEEGPPTRSSQLAASTIKNFIRPFDLSRAPLLRVGLIETGKDKHLLLVDTHHIIMDGTSTDIFKREFITLYQEEKLAPLRLQYKDFSQWQTNEKQKESIKQQEAYWLERFPPGGEVPVLNLPIDYPRPIMQSFAGSSVNFVLSQKETRALKRMAQEMGGTLYMVVLAVYTLLLSKLSGQEDIIVGTPIAARRYVDLESIIGMFANSIAMRNHPSAEKSFKEFLMEVKERTLATFENQEYQFEDLVEKVVLQRDTSRNPIFDVMFILQNMETTEIQIPGLKLKPYEYEQNTSKFDLTLTAVETGKKLLFTVEYCTKLFKEETILRFITYFKKILFSIQENSNIKIAGISIIPEEEKQRILYEFNETRSGYAADKTLHELFQEQAERTPDYIALHGCMAACMHGEGHITYSELNDKSNQLANLLIEKGVKPDTIAGIMVKRSVEMIIGILGILKAGGAYLPIDPGFPAERIRYMLEDTRAKVLLNAPESQRKAEVEEKFIEIIDISNYSSFTTLTSTCQVSPTNLAYVIYTSGSTGKPKGVMIHHQAVHNFIIGMTQRINFTPGKTILALTTISFDIFVLEALLPLLQGLRIVIADDQQQLGLDLLEELIVKTSVDMLQATPTRMQMFTGNGSPVSCLENLKEIMVGGEPFPGKLLGDLKQLTAAVIYNMYGPTETTVWSTMKELTHAQEITIGQPIANTQIYILDKNHLLQPIGVIGELYIGGDGLARGYINRPELTSEKFINYKSNGIHASMQSCNHAAMQYHSPSPQYPNTPLPHSPIYRTGDLARWLPKGELEFLGRKDQQVKIRGFRVELKEIEEQLVKHPDIKEAVVIVKVNQKKDKYLVAYIVPDLTDKEKETGPDVELITGYLSQQLPLYMIPSYFVSLERIPLTPNGKIDRKSLPEPDESRIKPLVKYVAPATEVEKIIADIWKQELGLEKVGINDNFFTLGATSLDLVKVNHRLKESFGKDIPVVALFRYRTISDFIHYLEQAEGDSLPILPKKDRSNALKRGERDKLMRIQMRKRRKQ
jgi:fengycin family lipopeptide synthetase D